MDEAQPLGDAVNDDVQEAAKDAPRDKEPRQNDRFAKICHKFELPRVLVEDNSLILRFREPR